MSLPKVVSRAEWLTARKDLLEQEKDVRETDVLGRLIKEAEANWRSDPEDPAKFTKLIEALRRPEQTEYDRLEAVFAQLRSEKIIALHRAGNTLADGHDDVREQWRAAGRMESGIRGCCFYHAQDLDRAVRTGRLHLAFSGGMIPEIEQREANTVVVGRRIVELLRAAGFGVQWSGNIDERIEADLGQWRKRGPSA